MKIGDKYKGKEILSETYICTNCISRAYYEKISPFKHISMKVYNYFKLTEIRDGSDMDMEVVGYSKVYYVGYLCDLCVNDTSVNIING